ncbi:Hypothetical predicted protein [Lecanosticta acicola]|uniref:Uncharacterized protein n=1 Tax=Lecanosticta acicola TaxID=111012 RepID=A0AAI9EDV2_9PEZI|nr:Hypothetical predicted protein [Lecanosticta acicola]
MAPRGSKYRSPTVGSISSNDDSAEPQDPPQAASQPVAPKPAPEKELQKQPPTPKSALKKPTNSTHSSSEPAPVASFSNDQNGRWTRQTQGQNSDDEAPASQPYAVMTARPRQNPPQPRHDTTPSQSRTGTPRRGDHTSWDSDDEPPARSRTSASPRQSSPADRSFGTMPSIDQQLGIEKPRYPSLQPACANIRPAASIPPDSMHAEQQARNSVALIDILRTSLYALENSLSSPSATLSKEASDNWETARALMERLDPVVKSQRQVATQNSV